MTVHTFLQQVGLRTFGPTWLLRSVILSFARTGVTEGRAAAQFVEGEQEVISQIPLRTRRQAFVATMLAAAIMLAVPSDRPLATGRRVR